MISLKLKKVIAILMVFTIIFGCKNNHQNHKISQDHYVFIDPYLENISCPLSEIIENIKVVHLETSPNCLIGYFSYLIFLNDKYIVFVSNKSILIFDNQGKYLSKIDALGKGPKEYGTIVNAFVDPINKMIYIVDYDDIKLYNFAGEYSSTFKLSSSSGGVYRRSNGKFVVVCSQGYSYEKREMLHLLDSNFNVYHTFYSNNPDVCKDIKQNLFFAGTPYEINGRLYYNEPFVETIYEISDTLLIPHWIISSGDRGYKTKDGISSINSHLAFNKIPPLGLRETENYFFINYTFRRGVFRSLFDKRNNKFIFHQEFSPRDFPANSSPSLGMKNDLIENSPLFWPKYINNSTIVSLAEPVSMTEEQRKKLGCTQDDNTVLFIGELK
jgi:hypothetical protein